jgi:hypothetical protein
VNDCAVLDISALADSYVVAVAPQNAVEPDAGVLANMDIANYVRAFCDERGGGDFWGHAFVWSDHCSTHVEREKRC